MNRELLEWPLDGITRLKMKKKNFESREVVEEYDDPP